MATNYHETESPWQSVGALVPNTAAIPHGRGFSDYTPSLNESEAKPSKAIEAVVYEFGMRWGCPRDVDPARYDARLRDLMRLCSEMAPGLLRKAGDRIAVTPGRFHVLPSASELHEAAEQIIAERAQQQARQTAQADYEQGRQPMTAGEHKMIEANHSLIQRGADTRWLLTPGGRWELVQVTGPAAVHRCNGDGTVEALVWSTRARDWVTQAYFEREMAA